MKKKILSVLLVLALVLCFAVPVMASEVTLELGVYDKVFNLENKDGAWQPIEGDSIGAQFGYNAAGPTFEFGLIAEGLSADTPYSLIYYADTEDRFNDWGGVVGDAGMVIAVGTSESDGSLVLTGTPDLGQNLPSLPDANAYFYNYTLLPDKYADATGAKIWLIPTHELSGGGAMPVETWGKDNSWLFETQLVNYADSDEDPEEMVAITVDPANLNFGLLTPSQPASEELTVTNTGFVDADVVSSVTGAFAGMSMTLNAEPVATWDTMLTAASPNFEIVTVAIVAPATPGDYSGVLTFTATAVAP